ncbi:MAG: OmpH family outer membrane protein [Pirellulaceae bacterium]
MRNRLFGTAALAMGCGFFFLGCAIRSATAQETGCVDVQGIVKQLAQSELDDLKTELRNVDADIKRRDSELAEMHGKISAMTSGAERNALIQQYQSQRDLLNLELERHKKSFLEKESAIYLAAYQKVLNSVAAVARANNLKSIVRLKDKRTFDVANSAPDELEPAERISGAIVFSATPIIDISDAVKQHLAGAQPKTAITNSTNNPTSRSTNSAAKTNRIETTSSSKTVRPVRISTQTPPNGDELQIAWFKKMEYRLNGTPPILLARAWRSYGRLGVSLRQTVSASSVPTEPL